jgi:hypothetical protein
MGDWPIAFAVPAQNNKAATRLRKHQCSQANGRHIILFYFGRLFRRQ